MLRLVLLLVGVLGVGALIVTQTGAEDAGRGPIAVANPSAASPLESVVGTVRHIRQAEGRELVLPDTLWPERAAQMLWFEGRAVSRLPDGGVVTMDGSGGVIRFDERLGPHRLRLALEGRVPLSVAAAADGSLWLVDAVGEVSHVGVDGDVTLAGHSPFDYTSITSDPDVGVWLARSTQAFSYRLASQQDPLLVRLGGPGADVDSLGSILLPEHVLLAELANAGHVVAAEDAVYFAPFIRDEVLALSRAGDTLWIASRGLPQSTPDPRFEIGDDGPQIDYAPVNLGLALGVDGGLYVLSVPGFTTAESRVDVYDPKTGALVRTARLDTPLPTLAVDADGRVYELDPLLLLTGIAPEEREPFAPFELERIDGGQMSLEELHGKVTLINFWASWCAPCRVEMPALDSVRRSIANPAFTFITMNEDVRVDDAAAFLEEHGFDFPVLLGRGKLRQQYHYLGLPLTLLLDREGRIVRRWIGFAGEEQVAEIRAIVEAELARGGEMSHVGHESGEMSDAPTMH
jgi:thiol-disulfide isomerase/thioredoxin